jgi:formate dehydrogenase subunit gamma
MVSRSTLRAAGALLVAVCFASTVAVAQSPAVNPKEAGDARAQQQRQITQPLNNQPVWSEIRSGAPQVTTVKGRETNVLIQPEGQTWRALRVPILFWGGILFALALLGLTVFHLVRGTMGGEGRPNERIIERFSPMDRYAHWFVAIVWVALAITGLILSLGKSVLLPLVGYTLFSWLATLSKTIHNFTGPLLIIGVPWLFARFIRDNGFSGEDIRWFTHIKGYFTGHEYPSDRFNAGEKTVFWFVLTIGSTALIVTGLILLFPNFDQTRSTMQIANVLHAVAAYLSIALACVHIYLGTLGLSGAYRAMRDGYVTESWAEHHHRRWYERIVAGKARQKFVVPETRRVDAERVEARRAEARTRPV